MQVELEEFVSEYVLDCYSILSEEHLAELLPGLPVSEVLSMVHDLAPSAAPARHPTLLALGTCHVINYGETIDLDPS